MTNLSPYTTEYDYSDDCKNKYYPRGPGNGLGPNGGYLWPGTRFETKEICDKVTAIANEAYRCGYEQMRRDLRKLQGIEK